jgi:VWFA-related protein
MKFPACLAVAAVVAATGLGAAPPAPPADSATFKAGVELVRLDVQVTDASGRPIRDLRQDEVQVLEGGHRRPVLFFQHVTPPAEPYIEAARQTIGSEVSTNQGAPRGHLYVLVFDQDHITPGREQKVRQVADRFLRTRLQPGDRVAIYGIPGPGPSLNFTGDVALAEHALGSVRGGLDRVGVGGLGSMGIDEAYEIVRGNELVLQRVVAGLSQASGSHDALADVPHQGGDDPSTFRRLVQEEARTLVGQADQRSRAFLATFSDLIGRLRAIEGRKTVFLFSEGFYPDHLSRSLEQVAAAAARSYSVVYAMDLNSRSVDPTRATPRGGDQQTEIQNRISPLSSLALATDGRLVNDAAAWLDRSMNAIASASEDYYLVGFEPSSAARHDRDGYHAVAVKVTRPGARVSTRTGYALPPPATPADRRQAIDMAIAAPFPEQAIPIDYTTYQLRASSADQTLIVLSVAADLPVASDAGRTADVVFVVRRASDGKVVANGTDRIPLPTAAASGSTTGVGTYRVQFEMTPGDYLMRVIIREPGGLVGSADRRFTVRQIGGPGVSAGDLLLGASRSGQLPARIRAYQGDLLVGTVPLYARVAQQLQNASVSFTLTPLGHSSTSTITMSGHAGAVQNATSGPERDAEVEFPLSGTPPGSYLAKAVIHAGGETVGEIERQITVLAGTAPAARTADASGSATPSPGDHEAADVLQGQIAQTFVTDLELRTPQGSPAAQAAALAARQDWSGAEKLLAAAPPMKTGDSASLLALRGLVHLARHDYAGASNALRQAFTVDQKDARLAFLLGWADMGAGDTRRAIGDWRNAALLDPSLVPAHLALADAYLSLANRALAMQALEAGLRSVPQSPELLAKLTAIEEKQ